MVTRFASDSPQFRDLSAKMLATFLLTMRGTPYYYNGDELGMTNIRMEKIEDYNDMPTLNEYQRLKNTGGDLREKIHGGNQILLPRQWPHAFSVGQFSKCRLHHRQTLAENQP